MTAVRCENVRKSFRAFEPGWRLRYQQKPALKGVSFEVAPGETFGILGANGSGKSTLIRIIATLLLADEGHVSVFGHDVRRHPNAVRRLIHRVSVEAAFFKKLSAWENLTFASRLYGIAPREVKQRGEEVLERLGFSLSKLHEPMENQSRGLQQKVAIARAMIVRPSLLLLDEPTTGLDPKSRRQVQEYLEQIRAEDGVTTILTTHDMNEAERLCQRLAIMRDGDIVALGPPASLGKGSLEDIFIQLAEEGVS
jgi:ABC-2 type transport system ATP-binding protein